MSRRASRRFVPSIYSRYYSGAPSYGDLYGAAPEATETSSTQGYIDMLLPAAKELLTTDDPRVIEAKIENLRKSLAKAPSSPLGLAIPGTKSFYQNEINKLQAKLESAQETKEEDETISQVYLMGRVGIMVGIFAGVAVLGLFAVNQAQKARLTQAEIERVRKGSAA